MTDPRDAVETYDVEESKLSEYLLNLSHAKGAAKAARLLRHNFTVATLRPALAEHGRSGVLQKIRRTPYGLRFEIVDPIPTPLNTYLHVRSVWEIRPASPTAARLITLVFEN